MCSVFPWILLFLVVGGITCLVIYTERIRFSNKNEFPTIDPDNNVLHDEVFKEQVAAIYKYIKKRVKTGKIICIEEVGRYTTYTCSRLRGYVKAANRTYFFNLFVKEQDKRGYIVEGKEYWTEVEEVLKTKLCLI